MPTTKSTTRSSRRSGTSARKPSRTAATRTRRRVATTQPAAAPKTGLPGWGDLGSKTRKKSATRKIKAAKTLRRARFLDAAPSLRFGVWTMIACIAVTLYVGHVYATQATLAALQQAERENLRLHLTHERLQGAYDRMTGPQAVMGRARALGLDEGIAYGPVIHLDH
ncbi:MAG: hypothetical protein HKN04_15605 [Rhodothermaceae bacterium]|nr:hypothetical protein [Rhodothermaceae bacterium]